MKIISLSLFSILLCFSLYNENDAKILIITPVYNRPDFIEWQHKTFEKFLKDEYEFRVFNDANDPQMEQAIQTTCAQLGISCIRVPQERHNVHPKCNQAPASFRHGESVQFAMEYCGFDHDDIVVLIDSDVFLIHELSIRDYLGDCDLYGFIFEKSLPYIVPQLCFFNMPHLNDRKTMNFCADFKKDGSFVEASDYTRDYTRDHPEIKWKIGVTMYGIFGKKPNCLGLDKHVNFSYQLNAMGYTSAEITLIKAMIYVAYEAYKIDPTINTEYECDIGFYDKNLFLDYKHGSGWHNPNSLVKGKKDKHIKDFMDAILI